MDKVTKTDEEWREQLSPEEFRVTRQAGTERPFTGKLLTEKRIGTFSCKCCGLELFQSDAKFESGCGWPSFFRPLEGAHLTNVEDYSHGMTRVEVRCSRCDAHLGHVFPDGPPPTGLRYCINSVCLTFEPVSGADE
ncbi:MAG: peptide-methionine (R)-S-oxide reductase MsrB [Myxococcota bacterium]|nr:peptide-methionine (R)-S-oxide reductase MsrB [Myxococcota bacterium]